MSSSSETVITAADVRITDAQVLEMIHESDLRRRKRKRLARKYASASEGKRLEARYRIQKDLESRGVSVAEFGDGTLLKLFVKNLPDIIRLLELLFG